MQDQDPKFTRYVFNEKILKLITCYACNLNNFMIIKKAPEYSELFNILMWLLFFFYLHVVKFQWCFTTEDFNHYF